MGFSIPGYLVALLAHGFLIWAVGNDLVRLLTGVAGDVMNNVPLALVPFGFGLAAAAIIWFLLRRRLNNAFTLVAICLVGFWAWWVLLEAGSGAKDMGKAAAVGLMAALIGATVGITTGAGLVWLMRQPTRG